MSQPLLSKDAVNVGGHKLPLPVVGAVVGVLGLVLILRARSKGSSVAAVGTAPATLPDTSSVGVLGNGQEAQLANLSQQLAGIQQSMNATPAANATPATPDLNKIGVLSFDRWLSGAFTGTRPDLAQGIAQNRWGDIAGQYGKEVAASEAQQLAVGGHF